MNVNPRQNDPQFQSPTQGDSERASQFGMGSQADVPGQGATSAQPQPVVPNPHLAVGPSSIAPGTKVYGSDGQKVGAVEEVYDDSFLVQKGIFFVRDYYIPLRYVAGVSNDRVDLSLTSDEARSQNWASRPGGPAQGAVDVSQAPTEYTEYGVYGPQGPEDTIQAATQRGETEAHLGPGLSTTPGIGQRAGTMPFERPLVPTEGSGPEGPGSGASAADYGEQGAAGPTPAQGSSQVPGTTPTDSAPEYGNMRRGSDQDELTGPPEPISPDQWTPERQGSDNP